METHPTHLGDGGQFFPLTKSVQTSHLTQRSFRIIGIFIPFPRIGFQGIVPSLKLLVPRFLKLNGVLFLCVQKNSNCSLETKSITDHNYIVNQRKAYFMLLEVVVDTN